MKERRKAIVWGAILILVGILALLGSLGFSWVRMENLWPLVLIVGGLFTLINAFTQDPRDLDSIWFGLTALMCGAFFAYITLGAGEWREMRSLWPVFPLIAGVAWLISWLFDVRQVSNLATGLIAILVGIGGFIYSLGRMEAGLLGAISQYWPLILVILGLGFLIQYFVQRR